MKINATDLNHIAEYIINKYEERKRKRSPLEKIWKEIDRQLRMEPDISFKKLADGKIDAKKQWMPEVELPGQAQTLEVLCADAYRLMFPDSGPWYAPHANMSDKYLERVDFTAIISGDDNEVPTQLNQDNADNLVRGALNYYHRQYEFRNNVNLINAESFKYGMGVGRVRVVNKTVIQHTSRGVMSEKAKIPILVPRSIKNTYLDDNPHNLMNEGYVVGPGHIFEKTINIQDLKAAADMGINDPKNENGGWMPKNLKNLEGDDDGNVKLLEWCGDITIPRKTSGDIFVPQVQITVVLGKEGKDETRRVCRVRFGESNIIEFPYHQEHLDTAYATSPLMKGCPIQAWATNALRKTIEAGELNTQPPIGYDRDDQEFATSGGPNIYPGAQWGSMGDIKEYKIGDPQSMFAIYAGALQQYADVTGVNAPRLGAQTVSHTTAYAKEAELNRGTVRTVDYVKNTLSGPMARFLDIEYKLCKKLLTKKTPIYIDAYRGFVNISSNELPDDVIFDVHGAGGPQEEQIKMQNRIQALQLAMQMDQIGAQFGKPPKVDLDKAIEEVLTQGGWTDVDVITGGTEAAGGFANESGLEGAGGASPGIITAALQNLQ